MSEETVPFKMEDYTTRTYGTGGLDNRPLFGETSARDRLINLVVGGLTSLLVVVTFISAFVFPHLTPKPVNVFFAVCILLSSLSALILSGKSEKGQEPSIVQEQDRGIVFCSICKTRQPY